MDFHFDEDQRAFADSARALFADRCSDEALRAHDASNAPFMQDLWGACAELGLQAIVLPEEAGGLGQGMTALMAVLEQQGRALALVPLAEHQLVAATLARFAPELLRPQADGVLALGLDGLAHARGLSLHARLQEDVLVLEGRAAAVPLAAQASGLLLAVRLGQATRLVHVPPQTSGLSFVEGRSQHHLAVADVVAVGVRLPTSALLAPEALDWLEPRWIAALAALQLGVSCGQLERTVDYVSQRRQFGRAIGTFQLVAGQLADGQIAVEALRSALCQLVYRLDAGLGAAATALAVKVLAAQTAHLVGHKAQHVHGGMGVDISYPIHRFLYWSRALANALGGAEPALQRLGDWLAADDRLGWKYDLPEDHGQARACASGDRHAV